MDALFIGHAYIDVTMLADAMPAGDEKAVARDYAVSFGGNAVTAGFACAKLGHDVHILTTQARDWLGHMFAEMADAYGVRLHPRKVSRSSLSFVLPNDGKRAILRARDDNYLQPFVRLDISAARVAASRRPYGRRGDPLRPRRARTGRARLSGRRRAPAPDRRADRLRRRRRRLEEAVRADGPERRRNAHLAEVPGLPRGRRDGR